MAEGFTPVTGVKLDCDESTSNDMAEDSEDKERLDDATLRAKAKVFFEKGNEAYKQEKDYTCAVHFYTQGIHVECKDTRLIAKLYSNRAAAHFHLGNYRETLADAKLALRLEPTLIKAIERGASACVKLKLFREAKLLCVGGRMIDCSRKTFAEVLTKCAVESLEGSQETHEREGKIHNHATAIQVFICHHSPLEYLELLLSVAEKTGDKAQERKFCELLGNAYEGLGQIQTAIKYHEHALIIEKEVGNIEVVGKRYFNLGNAYGRLEQFQTAIKCHELSLNIAKEVGDIDLEGESYSSLGYGYEGLGQIQTAIMYHEHALNIAKEVGNKAGEGKSYSSLGNAYHELEQFQTAIEYHELSLDVAKEVGDKDREGKSYCNLGNAYRSLGQSQTAIECYEHALNIAKEVRNKVVVAKSYCNLGFAYNRLGQFQTAIKYNEHALNIARDVGNKEVEVKSCRNLGDAYYELGQFQTCIEYIELVLIIEKEVGDKDEEGKSYYNLGVAYESLGQFQTAIKCYEHALNIAKEVRNKEVVAESCGNLGNAYYSLGKFQTAFKYHEHALNINKEVGDKVGEGRSYCNLGNAYKELGQFQTCIEYYELSLIIAKEVGNKDSEGTNYCNLGTAYTILGQFQTATKYLELALKFAEELGSKNLEEKVYRNLGIISTESGDSRKAIAFYERSLNIAKEVGDKDAEGESYLNIGNAHGNLREFQKAIEYQELSLNIAKEVGDEDSEGKIFCNLGILNHRLGNTETAVQYFVRASNITKELGNKLSAAKSLCGLGETLCTRGNLHEASNCFHSSLLLLDEIRANFQSKEEWKISFRDTSVDSYTPLWQLHLYLGEEVLALHTAEQGRAEALRDLLELKYGYEEEHCQSFSPQKSTITLLSCLPPNTVFIAVNHGTIFYWVVQNGKEVTFRANRVNNYISKEEVTIFIEMVLGKIGMKVHVKDEDRSYFETCDQRGKNDFLYSNPSPEDILKKLYEIVIAPIEDLVEGNEICLAPEGPLWLVPYAALLDSESKHLCDSLRIRMTPSLTTLKLISDCPADFHCKTGALLVGDPYLGEVLYKERKLSELPGARKEVEMIGDILGTDPLVGENATKVEVMKRLSSVTLVHIAAHGRIGSGEIFLAPNPTRTNQQPEEKDYLLTMKDVSQAKLRARLVVLSCCHSATGTIMAEGVVGIARAFMGAGARSVLVSLWALGDEATLEFMKHFYGELLQGKKASESLHRAMECMKKSEKYKDMMFWAPFVLLGDDVTLELTKNDTV